MDTHATHTQTHTQIHTHTHVHAHKSNFKKSGVPPEDQCTCGLKASFNTCRKYQFSARSNQFRLLILIEIAMLSHRDFMI